MKKDDQFNKKQLEKARADYKKLQAAILALKERNVSAMLALKNRKLALKLALKKRSDDPILQSKQKYVKLQEQIADLKRKAGGL